MIAPLLLAMIASASDSLDSLGRDSLPRPEESTVTSPRTRRPVGMSIQGNLLVTPRTGSSSFEPEPARPAVPPTPFQLGMGLRFMEPNWVGLRIMLGSHLDSGGAIGFELAFRDDFGKLSHDSTIRLRTESKGIRFACFGEWNHPLLPSLLSAHLKTGIGYRWEALHASSDTLKQSWGDLRVVETRSEWENGFVLPLGAGLRVQAHPRLRLVAGVEFHPSWTKARLRHSNSRHDLSGSGFHLSTTPIWSFGLDWITSLMF